METFILTCLQAKLIVGRINVYKVPKEIRNDLILELKQASPKNCPISIDAKVEPKERTLP